MTEYAIDTKNLFKTFKITKKRPGFKGAVKNLFSPNYIVKNALSDINLKIPRGKIIGFVGANGAGKTTLIKILTGIIHHTSGNVRVLGQDPWKRSPSHLKKISLIMGQKSQLWWDLPAWDCFELIQEIYQIPKKDFRERVFHLAEIFGIEDELYTQIRRLSLGERMKTELMASLLHNPEIIFLDEPTIGLDLNAQKNIRKFIKDFHKENAPTIILTSHYMTDIETLAEDILLIKDGEIVFNDTMESLKDLYKDRKVIQVTPSGVSFQEIEKIPQKQWGVLEEKDGNFIFKTNEKYFKDALQFFSSREWARKIEMSEPGIESIIERIMKGS